MPDEIIDNQQQQAEPTPQDIIKQNMDFAMNLKNPAPIQQQVAPAETAATTTQVTTPDYNAYLKEKFGFDNEETALNTFKELKEYKEKTPQTQAEIKYANDQSRKIHEALKADKYDEVEGFLKTRKILDGIDAKPEADRLKLYIQLTNPKFEADLVDDEYNELYGVNEEDFTDNPTGLRKAKAKAAQRMESDVEKAAEFFKNYRQKIELPDIQNTQVDEDYVNYKKQKEAQQAADAEVKEAYKTLAPKDIRETIKVNDEANKLNAEFSFEPDEKSFNETKQQVADGTFYNAYYGEDGSPNRQRFLQDMYYANPQNRQKAMTEAYLKGANAMKRQMVTSAAEGGGERREMVVTQDGELSEADILKQQMSLAMGNRNGRR